MARPESEHPTKLELEILKVLWEESPLPVREVRARLESQANRPLAHSSVITILNIMYRKGYLRRQKKGKSFLFSPKVEKENVAGSIMEDLLTRLFNGSPKEVMLSLFDCSEIDNEELKELRKIINQKMKSD